MSTESYLLKPHQHIEYAEELAVSVDDGTRTPQEDIVLLMLAQTHIQIAKAQMIGRQRA